MLAIDGWLADNESSRLKLTNVGHSFVAWCHAAFCVTSFMVQLNELQQFGTVVNMRVRYPDHSSSDSIYLQDQLQAPAAVNTPSVQETIETLNTPQVFNKECTASTKKLSNEGQDPVRVYTTPCVLDFSSPLNSHGMMDPLIWTAVTRISKHKKPSSPSTQPSTSTIVGQTGLAGPCPSTPNGQMRPAPRESWFRGTLGNPRQDDCTSMSMYKSLKTRRLEWLEVHTKNGARSGRNLWTPRQTTQYSERSHDLLQKREEQLAIHQHRLLAELRPDNEQFQCMDITFTELTDKYMNRLHTHVKELYAKHKNEWHNDHQE